MGTPTDPRRAHKDRRNSRAVHRVQILHAAGIDPASRARSGAVPGAQAAGIVAVDFLHVDTVLLERIYVLVFIEHGTRRMHIGGVTANPTGEWTVQQARNLALGLGERFEDIKVLVRDRGSNFTASFDAIFQTAGTRILRTAVQAPRMNAICERLVGTLRRELLDRMLILGEGASAHRPGRLPSALQHGPAAPGHRSVRPRRRTRRWPLRRCRPRPRTDPPKTRPWRPDQRILARCLTTQRLAGHQPDPIFERDRVTRAVPISRRKAHVALGQMRGRAATVSGQRGWPAISGRSIAPVAAWRHRAGRRPGGPARPGPAAAGVLRRAGR